MMRRNGLASVGMGLAAGALFGAATPFSKMLLGYMNSFQLAGLLYMGAAAAFLPYAIKNRQRELAWIRAGRQGKSIIGIVLFGGLLGPVFLLLGLRLAQASSVSVWLNMELVATAVLGVALFKDHLDLPAVFGVLLTLAAGVVMSVQDGFGSLLPAFFVTLACLCWGLDNHLTAIVDGASPKMITFIKGLFAGTTNLVIGTVLSGRGFPLQALGLALLTGMVSYGVSIVLYVSAAQELGATRSQILFSASPFWGILVALLVLREPMTPLVALAMGLLLLGIVLTNLVAHDHGHRHEELSHVHAHRHDDGHHGHEHQETGEGSGLTAGRHTHAHAHEAITHSHRHYPDMHHRHRHGKPA